MKNFERLLWVLLAGAMFVFWLTFFHNDATVVSFSPDTLQIRSYSKRSAGETLWQGRYHYRDIPVIQYLVEHDYVQPIATTEPRWLPMGYYTANSRGGSGHLAYAFGSRTIAWCEADPERARLFWSIVFPLLRSENKAEVRAGQALARYGMREMSTDDLLEFIESMLADSGVSIPMSAQAIAR